MRQMKPMRLSRPRRGLRPILLVGVLGACEASERPITFDLVLPEDRADLEATNNVSLVLEPDGTTFTTATDGLSFSLGIEVEPDVELRTLSIFLAQDAELLAWGRSVQFVTAGPDVSLAILAARPGQLSTFPNPLPAADAGVLPAYAAGRGLFLLDSDGDMFVQSELDYTVFTATALADPPPAEDGDLFVADDDTLLRVAWNGALDGRRYDPDLNTWVTLTANDVASRSGAVPLLDRDNDRLLLHGGDGRTEVLAIPLSVPGGDEGSLRDVVDPDLRLDRVRDGAAAARVVRDDQPVGYLLFGGDSTGPALFFQPSGSSVGPSLGPWTEAACAQLDELDGPRLLCVGGQRDGTATADGLLVTLPEGRGPTVEVLTDLLPVPLPDPLLLTDTSALYAQGEGRLFRLAAGQPTIGTGPADGFVEVQGPALRASGGHSVPLGTGATFVAGGVDTDGSPVDRLQVFMPSVESTDPP